MKETKDSIYIYQNELDKACFQHDKAYGDFKDLLRRTTADNVLRDKAFNIAINPRYDGYQCKLASLVHKFFDKKSSGSSIDVETIPNQLHKPINKKFEKRKVYSSFKDNMWGTDLANIQLISRFNKRTCKYRKMV